MTHSINLICTILARHSFIYVRKYHQRVCRWWFGNDIDKPWINVSSFEIFSFATLIMTSDLRVQKKNLMKYGSYDSYIVASCFSYKSLLHLITLLHRFNHQYVLRWYRCLWICLWCKSWCLVLGRIVYSGIHYITDVRALLLQESETRTSAVQGADQCTMDARPGRGLSRQQCWVIVKNHVEPPG